MDCGYKTGLSRIWFDLLPQAFDDRVNGIGAYSRELVMRIKMLGNLFPRTNLSAPFFQINQERIFQTGNILNFVVVHPYPVLLMVNFYSIANDRFLIANIHRENR